MALKTCKECSREYSDTLENCPHCGYSESSSKVTIYGYREAFALNPDVKIFIDGSEVAKVGRNESIELNIDKPCTIKFECSLRSTSCYVRPGESIILSFNRMTGTFSSTVTSNANATNELSNNNTKDSNNVVWVIVIIAILFLIYVFAQ